MASLLIASIISLKVFIKIFSFSGRFKKFSILLYLEDIRIVKTVIKIVIIEAAAPIPKAQKVDTGIPLFILSDQYTKGKIAGVKFAKVVPKPVKKLCTKNPNEYCKFI